MENIERTSPFEFRKPVTGKQFLNYKEYLKKMCSDLSGPALAFILGDKESGTSSFALELVNRLMIKYKDRNVIYVGLKDCKTEFDLLSKYIIPLINVLDKKSKLEDIEIEEDYLRDKNRLTELPEGMAKRRKRKVVLVLDDFEVIIGMPNQHKIEELLNTVWLNQKWISTCVFMKHTIETEAMLQDYGRPFYDPKKIPSIKGIQLADWYKLISETFKKNSQAIGKKEIKHLITKMNGVPKYIQSLSHYVYLTGKSKITTDDIDRAFNDVIELDRLSYRTKFNQFTKFQKRILMAVVNRSPIVVLRRYAEKTLHALKSVLTKSREEYYFSNPYFEHYLKKQNTMPATKFKENAEN